MCTSVFLHISVLAESLEWLERRHSHRAILNLEKVAPLVAGGGGLRRMSNLQTVTLSVIAAIIYHLAVRHKTMLNSISLSF